MSAPTFPFCCYCSFQTIVSLTGTLAGNTWFQSALPSVPVLNWTISCTQTQPQGKPSGPTHRLRSKYQHDFQSLTWSGTSALCWLFLLGCPCDSASHHTWHLPSSLVCQVQFCSCDFIYLGSDPLPLCLVETNSSMKVQPHGMESVQTPLSNLPTPGMTGQPKESKKEILKHKTHLPNHSHLTMSRTFIYWPLGVMLSLVEVFHWFSLQNTVTKFCFPVWVLTKEWEFKGIWKVIWMQSSRLLWFHLQKKFFFFLPLSHS